MATLAKEGRMASALRDNTVVRSRTNPVLCGVYFHPPTDKDEWGRVVGLDCDGVIVAHPTDLTWAQLEEVPPDEATTILASLAAARVSKIFRSDFETHVRPLLERRTC